MNEDIRIALVYMLIAYVAVANLLAAWLVWHIFGKLGWSPISRLLTAGFIASAIAWGAFTSTEPIIAIPKEWINDVILIGLFTKAFGMTAIVVGLWLWYRITTRYKRRR